MTVVTTAPTLPTIPEEAGSAPYTRRLLRRTGLVYAAVLVLSGVPWVLDLPEAWKVAGAGLAFPGAGFVTAMSWSTVWLLVVLVLAAIAGVAWLGTGMVIALPVVWLASVVAAVAVVGEPDPAGYMIVLAAVGVTGIATRVGSALRGRTRTARRAERNRTIETTINEVRSIRARAVEELLGAAAELDEDQASALRYATDLAHQPSDDWTGFDTIDIFQPAAVRYQINQLGWALAVAQSAYAPAFDGYLSSGQRHLIERYLQPEVLGYWKYERAWGHLRLDADPVGRDNIMLTGYYGLNLALYAGNTGDTRYHAEGALPFRVTKRRTYLHSADDVRDSLLQNYAAYHDSLCLYPCEPNWAYSGCNFRGAATLASYDRLQGTQHWPELREQFVDKLTTEFTTGDGSVVALRSTLTGLPVPFPMPDSVLPKELSPIAPDLAQRYWALVRGEILERRGDRWVPELAGVNLDFGNYTRSDMFTVGGLYGSAREMGDTEVAASMLAFIDETEPKAEGPALWYPNRSTLFNATVVMDRLLRPGGWHDAINLPTAPATLTGPVLEEVSYPEVIVLAATTDGAGIAATVAPGGHPGRRTLRFARLVGGHRYSVSTGGEVVAGPDGRVSIEVDLVGRLEVAVAPVG